MTKKKKNEEATDKAIAQEHVQEGRQKMNLEPGKRYQGSFWLNEYGVIEVRAAQEGTNPQGLKHVTGGDCYNIYESKNKIRIVLSFMKTDHDALIKLFRAVVTRVMAQMYTYKFL